MVRSRSRSRSPRRLRYEDVVRSRKRSRWEDDDDEGERKDRKESRDDRHQDRTRRKEHDPGSGRREDRKRRDKDGDGDVDDSDESYRRNRQQREEDHRVRSEAVREQEKERERRDRERERNRERKRGGGGGSDRAKDKQRRRRSRSGPRSKSQSRSRSRSPARGNKDPSDEAAPAEKEKATLERTHHLVAETNTVNGTVLKHVEPVDARLPPIRDKWKLYMFKGKEHLEDIPLSSRSCWLIGRDRTVADIPTDHPSCSGQHAALQFRFVTSVDEWGEKKGTVKPYIMDLKSVNGTFVNKVQIPSERYYELRSKDLVMFGLSTREYILMLEK